MNLLHCLLLGNNFATVFANNINRSTEINEKSFLSRSKDRIKQSYANFKTRSGEKLSRCRRSLNEKFCGNKENKEEPKPNHRRNKKFLDETGIKQNKLKENLVNLKEEAKRPFKRLGNNVVRAYKTKFNNDNEDKKLLIEY
jgi:hypothetical protein